ncbi:hypothetical protein RD792_017978 [Penstemon davidsonii]|uniref:CRAL-TRIO domain-containing protein n=1 Tax=Penstemon davidsonii TaxID=160366 RepID=A0ABR0DWD2_9LAMI|nr:hypothetical protein RD792_017978 [Penstemon davidsonii]
MSTIYDNWERLVAAVIRREELWQLCHDHSRSPSISSTSSSSDFSYAWSSTSNVLWDEHDYEPGEKKVVQELKDLVHEAIDSNPLAEIYIWGVKLMEDQRTDTILLKFLRARDFNVKLAFTMMKNTIKWRKEFGIDQLLEEDLGNELDNITFMNGYSKEGHPVCYSVYGEFQNKQLYQKMFSDEEKSHIFVKWKIQFLEKTIRQLDFNPGGISTFVQVNDLSNSPGINKRELLQAQKLAIQLLQDNYPDFVAKQVVNSAIHFNFYELMAIYLLMICIIYIYPEQIPVKYGGLSKEYGDFGVADSVAEVIVKPSSTLTVECPVTRECIVAWEARVVGWEVIYGAEFYPSAEHEYVVIVEKMRRIGSNQQLISSSFRVGQSGKVLLTIRNVTSKKKKLLYRFKIKLSNDL